MERLMRITTINIDSFSLVALSFIVKSVFIDEILFSNALVIPLSRRDAQRSSTSSPGGATKTNLFRRGLSKSMDNGMDTACTR